MAGVLFLKSDGHINFTSICTAYIFGMASDEFCGHAGLPWPFLGYINV